MTRYVYRDPDEKMPLSREEREPLMRKIVELIERERGDKFSFGDILMVLGDAQRYYAAIMAEMDEDGT